MRSSASRDVHLSPADLLKEQPGSAHPAGPLGTPRRRRRCPIPCALAGCSQRLDSCVRVGVHTELETACSGVPNPFFLPRQQALFHVLSAYSVYNTVSSEFGQFKCIELALHIYMF